MDADAESLEAVVARVQEGDAGAGEILMMRIRDRVYAFAVRMLGDPIEAEDAAQEVLLRVLTNLGQYRGEAKFTTWMYRLARNALINYRTRRRPPAPTLDFDAFAAVIDGGVATFAEAPPAADRVLAEEVRMTCTQGMLSCLDREHRLTYVLGEILELDGVEAAAILEIAPAAFRQRLARARKKLESFMQRRCGVYSKANPCRCERQVPYAMRTGMLDPQRLRFVPRMAEPPAPDTAEVLDLLDAAAVLRTRTELRAPDVVVDRLRRMIRGKPDA